MKNTKIKINNKPLLILFKIILIKKDYHTL